MACSYSQISGVDYTSNYAPVINDVTWRVLFILILIKKYYGILIGIGVTFLHGDLEGKFYMAISASYSLPGSD